MIINNVHQHAYIFNIQKKVHSQTCTYNRLNHQLLCYRTNKFVRHIDRAGIVCIQLGQKMKNCYGKLINFLKMQFGCLHTKLLE